MIFIDTSAFIARYVERDQYHAEAVDHWRQLRQDRRRVPPPPVEPGMPAREEAQVSS